MPGSHANRYDRNTAVGTIRPEWVISGKQMWVNSPERRRAGGEASRGEPYTQADVLEYWEFCDGLVDAAVNALDLHCAESGFSWYRMSKLEHQFVSIRHIQHHGGQLIDRVRSAAQVGIRWGWPRARALVQLLPKARVSPAVLPR